MHNATQSGICCENVSKVTYLKTKVESWLANGLLPLVIAVRLILSR